MHEMLVSGGLGGCYIGGTIWSKDGKAKGAQEDETGMDTVKDLEKVQQRQLWFLSLVLKNGMS